jgi:tetratricopeptide (TPR) repeat protein
MLKTLFTFFLFWLCLIAVAQAIESTKEIQKQSKKLSKSIAEKDEKASAESLVRLAETFEKKGDYTKCETYYQQALSIYEEEKDKKNIAQVSRALAKLKEKLEKPEASVILYEQAASNTDDKVLERMNANDAKRISAPVSTKEDLAKINLYESKRQNKTEEIGSNYVNLANAQAEKGQTVLATQNFQKAFDQFKDHEPQKAIEISNKIVAIQKEKNQLDQAILTQNKLIAEDFVKANTKTKVVAMQDLASLYVQNNEPIQALETLESAYQVALDKGHTLEARRVILKIDSLHKANKQPEKSLPFYRKFLKDLQTVLQKDQSLIDDRVIAETEGKIAQLLKERQLQNDLMKQQKRFNIGLGIFTVLLILAVLGILYAYKKLQIKNKKIALQSLRREMNPHFIFNSLNSVNHFIAQNNELEANQYLSKFSKLMRGIMENSTNDLISVAVEIDLIKNYLSLEKSRFHDKFDFELMIDENINLENSQVPSMLIQPFIENAIWHGLRYKEEKGFVNVSFKNEQKHILITIVDNGIGIKKSKVLKTKHQNQHKGRGMTNTLERIRLLNELYNQLIAFDIQDSENGVKVTLKIRI